MPQEVTSKTALELLDIYFKLDQKASDAPAYFCRAEAHLEMGDTERAMRCFEAALEQEALHPNTVTGAALQLPFVIAVNRVRGRYPQAIELLSKKNPLIILPIQHFKYHAAAAYILEDSGDCKTAKRHAQEALAAAKRQESGFYRHKKIGLVGPEFDGVCVQLRVIAGYSPRKALAADIIMAGFAFLIRLFRTVLGLP